MLPGENDLWRLLLTVFRIHRDTHLDLFPLTPDLVFH